MDLKKKELISIDETLKTLFEKYQRRLTLDKITFFEREIKRIGQHGSMENSLNLHLKRCPYCGTKKCFSFSQVEIPEIWDKLKEIAVSFDKEKQEKELNFT